MKLTTLTTLALMMTAPAFAGHVANGYRDTGCDAAAQVQITNDKGEYLYSLNPTCPATGGSFSIAQAVYDAAQEAAAK